MSYRELNVIGKELIRIWKQEKKEEKKQQDTAVKDAKKASDKENEAKMNRHAASIIGEIGKAMNPTIMSTPAARTTWNVVPYQSTHNTGGAIMGADPATSVVNKYQQVWDVSNVFVTGAGAFPHNSGYNPTGPVGALAYWAADAIRDKYLKSPGPLI